MPANLGLCFGLCRASAFFRWEWIRTISGGVSWYSCLVNTPNVGFCLQSYRYDNGVAASGWWIRWWARTVGTFVTHLRGRLCSRYRRTTWPRRWLGPNQSASSPSPGIPIRSVDIFLKREKMYGFFMSLKQSDGSFLVTHHAEVDVRFAFVIPFHRYIFSKSFISGIYCMLVTAHLLNLLTPELVEGTASFIASCQTYEGGFSSASLPYYFQGSLLPEPRPPLGEAHGGYTFCALASWVMLQPFINAESCSKNKNKPHINLKTLLRWLSQMQGAEIEIGGFRGRTNKLVDGCYSWWVGASFPLLEAFGLGGSRVIDFEHGQDLSDEGDWTDVDGLLHDYQYYCWLFDHWS